MADFIAPVFRKISPRFRTDTFKHGLFLLIGVLTFLVGLTLIAEKYQLDQSWTSHFYRSGQGWYLSHAQPWQALNSYGTLPGLLLSTGALIGLYLSYVRPRWQDLRRYFLLVILAVIIGPGLLVNSCLKNYWGRPRPIQTTLYEGKWEYRPVFSPGTPGRGKSFPCGHCTMGYSFLTLAVFWKRSRRLAWIGVLWGLFYGSLLGLARMVAGAHFPTDVLWSLGIVTMVNVILYYWVFQIPAFSHYRPQNTVRPRNRRLAIKVAVAGLLILLAFLSRRPYFDSYVIPIKLTEDTRQLIIHDNMSFAKTDIHYLPEAQPRVVVNAQGFSFPFSKHTVQNRQQNAARTVHIYIEMKNKGYNAESNYSCEVILPMQFKDVLNVVTE